MKTVSLADAKAGLASYVRECAKGECAKGCPVVITRNGKAVAVLVSPNDDDLERLILARSPRFQALLRKSERSIDAGRGLTRDQFWKVVAERARKRSTKKR